MLSFFYQASNLYTKLSFSEKKLVTYISTHRDDVMMMPVAVLAEKTGVSSATVVSTAKKLGFSGYSELKLSLAAEVSIPLIEWADPGLTDQDTTDVLEQVVRENINALRQLQSHMSHQALWMAADMLLHANRVFIFGEGTSDALAAEAYDFLIRLGICCIHERDWQSKLVLTGYLKERDVGVLISQSGINKNILDMADRFAQSGVRTIGISNFQRTALSQKVNVMLAALPTISATHDNNYTFRIPVLCILESLHRVIARQSDERYKMVMEENCRLVKMWSMDMEEAGSDPDRSK